MTDNVTDLRDRLNARLNRVDDRASAAWWQAQWAERDDGDLETTWRGDLLEAQASGADAAEMDRMVITLSGRLGVGRRAIRQSLREAQNGAEILEENTTNFWARRWIQMQDDAGGFRPGPGCAYYTRDDDPIWRTMSLDDATVDIGTTLAGPGCRNRNDYRAIARHALAILERDGTRPGPNVQPKGVALGDELLRLDGHKVVTEDLHEDHHCRFRLNAELMPLKKATHYQNYLRTLAPDGAEDADDIRLAFAQATFAVLFNLGEEMQQAILFVGEAGSGKSTGQAILSALVPKELRCSVPPSKWGNEYQLAHLSRAAVNVVEDLEYRKPLGDEFKRMVGNQTSATARDPYGLAFDFEPNITHLFSSNELPATRIHDEGFWRRWIIVPFWHPIDSTQRVNGLGKTIIEKELGAVVQHALDAASSLFDERGQLIYKPPAFHKRIMNAWEREQNIVLQFLEDEEWVVYDEEGRIGRTLLWETFREWVRANGYAEPGRRTFTRDINRIAPIKGMELRKLHNDRVWTGVRLADHARRAF